MKNSNSGRVSFKQRCWGAEGWQVSGDVVTSGTEDESDTKEIKEILHNGLRPVNSLATLQNLRGDVSLVHCR